MKSTIHSLSLPKFDHKRKETIAYRLTNHIYTTLRSNIKNIINLTHLKIRKLITLRF